MNMEITKQTRILLVLSLLGMGLVLLTRFVRPNLVDPLSWVGFAFGVMPNFGAGLGLPGVLATVVHGYEKSQGREISPAKMIIIATFISEAGLFGWEFLQYFFWKLPVDLFDLAATFLGGAITLGLGLWKAENRE
ncbi:MAG: hypothetical protein CVU42_17560 [Chloroflexi bacterium HGW-Chloroflexi-4]|jgi:hypothetical protein|nr:MAG: hypothetical protein CVU42_17560 [Chloroflexi bacterium HGW-Chloroflexi-4]